jgi:GntR family transcriptional regulator
MERATEMPVLSKDGSRPLYVQLFEMLRERLRSGALKPGDLIPAESELVRTYGVSRITVRAALDQLVKDGYIDRHRGRGSFVRAVAPEARACLTSFTDQMLALGRRPGATVLAVRVAPAAAFAAEAASPGGASLPFAPEMEVALVERVRSVDGRPVAVVRSFIPHALVPGVDRGAFASDGPEQSLLYVLEHRFGIVLDKGEETLVPTRSDAPTAATLGISVGDPLALKVCTVRDRAGAPVLFDLAFWCAPQTQLIQRVAVAA